MSDDLADVLGRFVQRSRYSRGQLAELSGVPKRTIANWLEGRVTRPHQWQPLLKVAAALRLDETETTALLQVADHPPLIELRAGVSAETDRALLAPWPVSRAPFQAIADLPYFIGREHELAQLRRTLLNGGYVTICNVWGMGGVGKTSLAAHLAYQLRPHFPDGVLWARLDTTDTLSILSAFAAAYDHDVSSYTDVDSRSSAVRALLADKRVLIVLDNAQSSAQVRPLLPPTTGRPAVIITTRHDLEIADQLDRVALEPFARESGEALTLFTRLLGERRVRLFRSELQQIADMLGHLPLALALVAGRLAYLPDRSVSDFFDRLRRADQRLNELACEDRSVRLTFDLSYEQLSPDQQKFFAALGAFGGDDFSIEAAAYVAGISADSAAGQLDRLVQLSLVQPSEEKESRRYVEESLAIAREINDPVAILKCVGNLGVCVAKLGDYPLAEEHFHTSLLLAKQLGRHETEITMLQNLAWLAWHRHDYEHADAFSLEAATLAQSTGRREALIGVLGNHSQSHFARGDVTQAETLMQEALRIAREISHQRSIPDMLADLGQYAYKAGDFDRAADYWRESLQLAHQTGNLGLVSRVLTHQAEQQIACGQLGEAETIAQTALSQARQINNQELMADALFALAQVALARDNVTVAVDYGHNCLALMEAANPRRSNEVRQWLDKVQLSKGPDN